MTTEPDRPRRDVSIEEAQRMPMSEGELEAIEARVSATTPAGWHWDWQHGDATTETYVVDANEGWRGRVCTTQREKRGYDDALFIAHARDDVPALVAEVRRLRAENARLDAEAQMWANR